MNPIYRSPLPFSPDPSPALAVYCSDSRYDEHCDYFVLHGLNLEVFDQFIVPGGAAWLVWDWQATNKHHVAKEQLSFLVESHHIHRAVLIAHDDCGFYRKRYSELTPDERRRKQLEDLELARRELQLMAPELQVDLYFARVGDDGVVCFDAVGEAPT